MIGKITKGSRPGDIARYLHGRGNRDEHTYGGQPGGMVIGGNLGREGSRDPRGWAADMDSYARTAKGKLPIWHASLRNADGDRVLSDEEWAEAGQLFAEEMGYQDKPWVMVRHADDHVHIVMCRQGDDGPMWSDRDDRPRMMAAKSKLEKRYGLTEVPVPEQHQEAADKAGHKLTQGEIAKAHRTGETPPRVRLAERVRRARATAMDGGGREMFEAQMDGLGVEFKMSTRKDGTPRGYTFHLRGHEDEAGQPVWFPASKLDRSLSWSNLRDDLESAPPASKPRSLAFGQAWGTAEMRAENAAAAVPEPKRPGRFTSKRKQARRQEAYEQAKIDASANAVANYRMKGVLDMISRDATSIDLDLGKSWTQRRRRLGKSLEQRKADQQADLDAEAQRQARADRQKQRKQQQRQAEIARERAEKKRLDEMFKPSYSPPSAPQKDEKQPGG